MSDFIERLKNKLTYLMYNVVNDDDANRYVEEQKKHKEEQKTEPLQADVKEQYDDKATTETTDSTDKISVKRIITQFWEYLQYFGRILFFPLLSLYVASLVANDLIVYPVAIRVIFFIFVFTICITNALIASGFGIFYIGKKLYEMYLNRDRDDKPNPPIKLMPRIFAMLPVTTTQSDNIVGKIFLYPFSYLKEETLEANSNGIMPKTQEEYLKDVMEQYKKTLNDSFPYYKKVSGETAFVEQKKEFDTLHDSMHAKPKVKPEVKSEVQKEPPLPNVISANNIAAAKERALAKEKAEIEAKAKAEADAFAKTPEQVKRKEYINAQVQKEISAAKEPLTINERAALEQKIGNKYNAEQKNRLPSVIEEAPASAPPASAPPASAPPASAPPESEIVPSEAPAVAPEAPAVAPVAPAPVAPAEAQNP